VESEPGKGTTFTIYLPRVSGSATLSPGVERSHGTIERGHGYILIVEDEEAVGALAQRILTSHGYTVLAASSAAEALGVLSDPVRRIDLLITDLVLPGGKQGGELADAARSMREGLGVLYMSGYSRDASIHGGRLDEGINFLQKPFTATELIATVEDAFAGSSRLTRPRSKSCRGKEEG